jgi:hypothetical protein
MYQRQKNISKDAKKYFKFLTVMTYIMNINIITFQIPYNIKTEKVTVKNTIKESLIQQKCSTWNQFL